MTGEQKAEIVNAFKGGMSVMECFIAHDFVKEYEEVEEAIRWALRKQREKE